MYKEQSITIKASSGLSDAEVEKMIKDAEAHAGEDKKFQIFLLIICKIYWKMTKNLGKLP